MRYVVLLLAIFAVLALPASCQTINTGDVPVPATLPAQPGGGTGYFSIQSNPPNADTYFDGTFYGETPVIVPVSTTGNPSHTVQISLPGYETWSTTYQGNPAAGQTIPITATLTPSRQTGNIQVSSSPSGASVTLDRSQAAVTPYTFYNIPVGSHEVAVYLSGYQTFYSNVNVNSGQTMYINAVLTPTVTTGSARIESNPSGAAVYVDQIYRGVTSTIVGNLAPGSHDVRLSKAGYQDWIGTVSISAGATAYLGPTLVPDQKPQYATVTMSSNPPGANVYANGIYVGQTSAAYPLVFTQVTPGTYSILLSKTGYQDYTATRTVAAGQNYDVTVTMTPVQNPTTGGISIISSPSGADVYLNNAFRGLTPLTLDSLAPGSYGVLVQLPGYNDWSTTTQVAAGQTVQLSATLTATPTPTPTPLLPAGVLAALGLVFVVLRRR